MTNTPVQLGTQLARQSSPGPTYALPELKPLVGPGRVVTPFVAARIAVALAPA
jgi:hypothetical protein